ncbi:thioredoxin-disulfide reductase [Myroides odoratus]|jgi:thioredoxin reductase (NADPH)|uniref:Thioredoxin reductase n=1 Tax=Myroides odoratus TaxID=256 RepID=A0A9Q6ZGA5_MYROD|nr:thioredoxin-disulfide reductase [Myroides odoratus]EHQ43572.1 thioredoxin reductase [Myroides odoratus DSM 2801]EKB05907.1 thioredoxin-disulfide reductase [Myroides odoratus CIP 103059]QQU00895.1 thioredoxin-disulfide reductase [Myroides odoratus]WQD56857.1 thioredoxin-disulfide reductase [Myroides odoratus]STZ30849.1 Thioredoxin reductase [Myroides odoratus]
MSTIERTKCLIIGSGPAGYTAAIYAARANMAPILYQGLQPGGQLTTTNDVENFPGYPEGVTGPEMMLQLEAQAKRFGTDVRDGWVTKVDLSGAVKKVWVNETTELHADTVIISTGATAKYLGLPSEQHYLNLGGGVSACAVCDGFFYRNQEVVIVGAGDSACEEAHYLSKLCKKVTMLVRSDSFRASKIMEDRVRNTENIEILMNTSTVEVLGDGNVVTGIKVKNNETGVESDIPATGFFVAIGHKPNTDIFKGQLTMDETGYLLTTGKTSATNIEGVFACGDVQDKDYRQAITAAGSGCIAALDAERYLASQE